MVGRKRYDADLAGGLAAIRGGARQERLNTGKIYECKLDGVRCLAFRNGSRVRVLSRNRQSLNGTYPEVVETLAAQPCSRFVVLARIVASGRAGS